ncbi:kleisin alpha ASCRUDRAFT_78787 [Ascoidea rubescens DSM 1968]|uniref:Rad21/Rec8-like protein N-terminal domain-containing protein n=1 Tax=Ascoidea rubescens DSM 1968 TaxID=1344418 RepID=A0A1D2VQ62_9ASCO|nr:hypothetical protein ASCRUDRAFT_78787 [Ascoidea rubescens DSM 1968]ODV63762.1 hypothetical protein ASCRUDRAFT_78787 [Ascoidea rubescens DSM 1968]
MFYNEDLLLKQGPLATVWLAANLDKKLTKNQYLNTNITQSAQVILKNAFQSSSDVSISSQRTRQPTTATPTTTTTTATNGRVIHQQPIALRLSGQLLYGITKIYSKKEKFLLDDVTNVLTNLKKIFKPSNLNQVILPPNATITTFNNLILQDTITDTDLLWQEPLYLDLDDSIAPIASTKTKTYDQRKKQHLKPDQLHFQLDLNLEDETHDLEYGRDVQNPLSSPHQNIYPLPTSKVDDLMFSNDNLEIDFGNDFGLNLTEEQQKTPLPQKGDHSLTLDFGDQPGDHSIEAGRRAAAPLSDNIIPDISEPDLNQKDAQDFADFDIATIDARDFTIDFQLPKTPEPQTAKEDQPQTPLTPLTPAEEADLNNALPIQLPAQPEQQQQRADLQLQPIIPRKRRTYRRVGPTNALNVLKKSKIIHDSLTELPSLASQISDNYIDSLNNLLYPKIDDLLFPENKLNYINKISNPANNFLSNNNLFNQLWDVKDLNKELQAEAEARRKITLQKEAKKAEKETKAAGALEFDFDMDMDINFPELSETQALAPSQAIEDKELVEKENEEILKEEQEKEKEKEKGKEIKKEIEKTIDQLADEEDIISQTFEQRELESDQLISSLAHPSSSVHSETFDEETASVSTQSSSKISKTTINIASSLREEFFDFGSNPEKSTSFSNLISTNIQSTNPLSTIPKKQATRCFFELLVLATGDTVKLQQNQLFGEIEIKGKENLFSKFI